MDKKLSASICIPVHSRRGKARSQEATFMFAFVLGSQNLKWPFPFDYSNFHSHSWIAILLPEVPASPAGTKSMTRSTRRQARNPASLKSTLLTRGRERKLSQKEGIKEGSVGLQYHWKSSVPWALLRVLKHLYPAALGPTA